MNMQQIKAKALESLYDKSAATVERDAVLDALDKIRGIALDSTGQRADIRLGAVMRIADRELHKFGR